MGLSESVIEMSTTNIAWGGGKGGRCLGLINLPPSCADCLEIWEPQPPGSFRASSGPVQGLVYFLSKFFILSEKEILVQDMHIKIY
jgi:hypothetical protein